MPWNFLPCLFSQFIPIDLPTLEEQHQQCDSERETPEMPPGVPVRETDSPNARRQEMNGQLLVGT